MKFMATIMGYHVYKKMYAEMRKVIMLYSQLFNQNMFSFQLCCHVYKKMYAEMRKVIMLYSQLFNQNMFSFQLCCFTHKEPHIEFNP